jgi:hypothetical protein
MLFLKYSLFKTSSLLQDEEQLWLFVLWLSVRLPNYHPLSECLLIFNTISLLFHTFFPNLLWIIIVYIGSTLINLNDKKSLKKICLISIYLNNDIVIGISKSIVLTIILIYEIINFLFSIKCLYYRYLGKYLLDRFFLNSFCRLNW